MSAPAPGRTRRARPARWVAIGVGVVLALLVVVLATRPRGGVREVTSPLLGRPAPPVSGFALDGQPFDLSQRKGRYVLVNFFATWCVPCRQEHPELVRWQLTQDQTASGAEVVSVVYDDDPAAVRDFFAAEGGDWAVLGDPDGRIAVDYGVAGIPESYLVDPNGFVVSKISGGVNAEGLDELLARAREGATTTVGGGG